jgi:cold shock CspA family protein
MSCVVDLVRERVKVSMWAPSKFYGFTEDEAGAQVFFHIRVFRWGTFPTFPPPVVGEEVDVEYDPSYRKTNRAPKARLVHRLHEPVPSFGIVDVFDDQRGYGFIRTEDGRSHYLHRSEMTDERLPMPGMTVTFFEGIRQGRTRACYIQLSEG